MDGLKLFERIVLPDYRKVRHVSWGTLTIKVESCTGCGLCARACPANSLMVVNKKASMKPETGRLTGDPGINQCMACGDCAALCPAGAISLAASYRWTRFFRTPGRGKLSPPRL